MKKIKKYNQFILERKSSSVNEELGLEWLKNGWAKIKNNFDKQKGKFFISAIRKLIPDDLLTLIEAEVAKYTKKVNPTNDSLNTNLVDKLFEELFNSPEIEVLNSDGKPKEFDELTEEEQNAYLTQCGDYLSSNGLVMKDVEGKFLSKNQKFVEFLEERGIPVYAQIISKTTPSTDNLFKKIDQMDINPLAKKSLKVLVYIFFIFMIAKKAEAGELAGELSDNLHDTSAYTDIDDDGSDDGDGTIQAQPLPKDAKKITDGLYKIEIPEKDGVKTMKGEGERGGIKVGNLPDNIKNNPLESKFDDLKKPDKSNPNNKVSDVQLMELTFLKISTQLDNLGENPSMEDIKKVVDNVQKEIDNSSAKGDITIKISDDGTKVLFDQKMNQTDTDKVDDKTGEVVGKWKTGEISKGRLGGIIDSDKTPSIPGDETYLVKVVINGYKITAGQSQPQQNSTNWNIIENDFNSFVKKFSLDNNTGHQFMQDNELAKGKGNLQGEYYLTASDAKALIDSGWGHLPHKSNAIDNVLNQVKIDKELPKFENKGGVVHIKLTNNNIDEVKNLLQILSKAKIYSSGIKSK